LYGLYGAVEGYVAGKLRAEAAARELFPGRAAVVGPSLILGEARLPRVARLLRALPPSKLLNKVLRAKAGVSVFEPGDALGELAREPPALPDEAARAAAAALLGLVPGDYERPGVVPEDGGDRGRTVPCPIDAVDGSAAIRDVAARFGTDENIAAGAAKLAAERPRGGGGARRGRRCSGRRGGGRGRENTTRFGRVAGLWWRGEVGVPRGVELRTLETPAIRRSPSKGKV
jgi:hypothetical protein